MIIIANLKPAVLRGVESQGMLLAGQGGDTVRVLETQATPGTQVTIEGITQKPMQQIDIDTFLALGLKVEKGKPSYKEKQQHAGRMPVTIQDVRDGIIR